MFQKSVIVPEKCSIKIVFIYIEFCFVLLNNIKHTYIVRETVVYGKLAISISVMAVCTLTSKIIPNSFLNPKLKPQRERVRTSSDHRPPAQERSWQDYAMYGGAIWLVGENQ